MSFFSAPRSSLLSPCLRSFLTIILLTGSGLANAVEPVEGNREMAPIIAGDTASVARPWMAALVRSSSLSDLSDRHFCGGALIAATWVITAAHCIEGLEPDSLKVLLGRLDLDAANPQLHDVVELITHPFYHSGSRFYDIGLIRLAVPSSNRSIAMATAAMTTEARGQAMQVLGWGATVYDDTAACTMHFLDSVSNQSDFACKTWVYEVSTKPQVLMQTELVLQPYEQCDARFKAVLDKLKIPYGSEAIFSETNTPDVLCLWDAQDNSSPCYGDSGGPLFRSVGGSERLFGVIGGGTVPDCLLTDQIGIFASAAYFTSFVNHTLNRGLFLGRTRLCPSRLSPTVTYTARSDGLQDVKLSWSKDPVAQGYRVFHASHAGMGNDAQRLKLPADKTETSMVLTQGQKLFVAVQGVSGRCDGPLSSVVLVKVP